MTDIIVFSSKSRDCIGLTGIGEQNETGTDYSTRLCSYKNWRRILDRSDIRVFKFEKYRYVSIEHALYAEKAKFFSKPKLAFKYTFDSGCACDIRYLHQMFWYKLKTFEKEEWERYLNDTTIMEEITMAKFQTSKEASEILKLTYPAQLWRYENNIGEKKKHVRCEYLEKIRDELLLSF